MLSKKILISGKDGAPLLFYDHAINYAPLIRVTNDTDSEAVTYFKLTERAKDVLGSQTILTNELLSIPAKETISVSLKFLTLGSQQGRSFSVYPFEVECCMIPTSTTIVKEEVVKEEVKVDVKVEEDPKEEKVTKEDIKNINMLKIPRQKTEIIDGKQPVVNSIKRGRRPK